MLPKSSTVRQVAALVVFALAFVGVSYLAHAYQAQLADIVQSGGVSGIVGFVVLIIIFVVFVIPLDLVLLLPLGVAVWGPIPTALLCITGWTLGAGIAFGISRRFGVGVVEKFIGLERVRAVERRIPERNLFASVIILRMLVSVDILSYALGLFSTMRWGPYMLATAIGVSPFGFYFAYAGTLPFGYQLAAVGGALALATIALLKYGIRREP